MSNGMFYIILSALLMAISLILSLMNTQMIPFNLFSHHANISCSYVMISMWILGFVSLFVYKIKSKIVYNNSKVAMDWQVQDAKLAAQITSDKEKQLQAKIDTLEAAQWLKKCQAELSNEATENDETK